MPTKMQILSPQVLGFWVQCIRTSLGWSQEALAEASGLNTRTIQRIESGQSASVTTRRSLARGLGYENPDIFDDLNFIQEINQFLQAVTDASENEKFPDHLKLSAKVVDSGDHLGRLVSASSSYLFNVDDEVSADAKVSAAVLFDNLMDYGDVWSDISHRDRLIAASSFDENLAELHRLGAKIYTATRSTKIVGAGWKDKTPLQIDIGYVIVVPSNKALDHIMVPKRLNGVV